MKHPGRRSFVLLGAITLACASPAGSDSDKADADFQSLALPSVPADVQHPTFVDFGGKVHLVGWDVSPATTAAPGSTITLKLYWRSVKPAPACYRLYTHLTAPDGKVYEFDDVGALRASTDSEMGKVPRLPPSAWKVGTIYVDEQRLKVPDVDVPVLTLSVGLSCPAYDTVDGRLEKTGEFKLPVLSGVSDGNEGALVGRFVTGAKRGNKAKEGRRRPGQRPGADGRPSREPLGRAPMGAGPGAEREKRQ